MQLFLVFVSILPIVNAAFSGYVWSAVGVACPDATHKVATKEECEWAAIAMGHSVRTATQDSSFTDGNTITAGCYTNNGDSTLWFNPFGVEGTCSGVNDCKSLCRAVSGEDWALGSTERCAMVAGENWMGIGGNQDVQTGFNVNNPQECIDACNDNDDCEYWALTSGGSCWLKKNYVNPGGGGTASGWKCQAATTPAATTPAATTPAATTAAATTAGPTGCSADGWVYNNHNSADEIEAGYDLADRWACLELVKADCPTATIANYEDDDGYCFCQFGTNMAEDDTSDYMNCLIDPPPPAATTAAATTAAATTDPNATAAATTAAATTACVDVNYVDTPSNGRLTCAGLTSNTSLTDTEKCAITEVATACCASCTGLTTDGTGLSSASHATPVLAMLIAAIVTMFF